MQGSSAREAIQACGDLRRTWTPAAQPVPAVIEVPTISTLHLQSLLERQNLVPAVIEVPTISTPSPPNN